MRLPDLIEAQMRACGLVTLDDLVVAAATAGHPVSRNTWRRLMRGPLVNFPETATLTGVAGALRVDIHDVITATIESIGVPSRAVQLTPDAQAVVSMISAATPEQQTALVDVLRAVSSAFAPGAARAESH